MQGWGGKLSRAVYLAPHLGIMFNFFNTHFTCFKLSVHEVVSFNHNSSQIELFSLSFGLIPLVAGLGGKLSKAVYLTPTWVMRVKIFHAHFTCFKYLNMKMIHL